MSVTVRRANTLGIERGDLDVLTTPEDDITVNFIGDDDHIVAVARGGEAFELEAGEHAPRRVLDCTG